MDKGDCKISKLMPVAGDMQKTNYKYLLEKQTKQNLNDGHLWFSVLAKPIHSSFGRLDRWTCCVVLLFMSMLMNILYYDVDKTSNPNALKIGPFSLTPEQIGIGIICNLVVFPPSFLLIFIFRRARKRVSKTRRLKYAVDRLNSERASYIRLMSSRQRDADHPSEDEPDDNEKEKPNTKSKMLTFPWWTKTIAYFVSWSIIAISIFFIIIKGIEFGQEKVGKWLTSLVVSIDRKSVV